LRWANVNGGLGRVGFGVDLEFVGNSLFDARFSTNSIWWMESVGNLCRPSRFPT
jgi:hypothetical protein